MRCTFFRQATFRRDTLPGAAWLFAIVLTIALPALAQTGANVQLTNSDVIKMVKAGVPEGVIVRTIQVSEPAFVMTPNELVELKHKHVPDTVLGAMMDSQGAGRMQPYQPQQAYPPVQVSGQHIHQLPNIDAAIRLEDRSVAKVQVRKNQIKVEKAGIPLFSVKWKVNEK